MVQKFENMLSDGGLDKLVTSQLENVFTKVNDQVKKHIDFRRQESLKKKEKERERRLSGNKGVQNINDLK